MSRSHINNNNRILAALSKDQSKRYLNKGPTINVQQLQPHEAKYVHPRNVTLELYDSETKPGGMKKFGEPIEICLDSSKKSNLCLYDADSSSKVPDKRIASDSKCGFLEQTGPLRNVLDGTEGSEPTFDEPYLLDTGTVNKSISSPPVESVCTELMNDTNLVNGYNGIGFSQGGHNPSRLERIAKQQTKSPIHTAVAVICDQAGKDQAWTNKTGLKNHSEDKRRKKVASIKEHVASETGRCDQDTPPMQTYILGIVVSNFQETSYNGYLRHKAFNRYLRNSDMLQSLEQSSENLNWIRDKDIP
ncbi:hypothetical protein AND_005475 [Anopheles darlingi]|uniref:Uncharacterized protein n=1 Tax=Anopheles darlingi TaxID=43151 RepID=W5JIW2_ANODA|nr:hypothetical protein AND_005475 [Anopheles darlingi]